MPELPEVEVLVRHLGPRLRNQTIRGVEVNRLRVLAGTHPEELRDVLVGAIFQNLRRRGKYLVFELASAGETHWPRRQQRRSAPSNSLATSRSVELLGHLGMTGRMYLLPNTTTLPKHAAVVFDLGQHKFVFEDTRYFGKLTLDLTALEKLGPEPLGTDFTPGAFKEALKRSSQPIKIKLLDQSVVCGLGNIYASEALFHVGISPRLPARKLTQRQVRQLWQAIRDVLGRAIEWGSTVPLNYSGTRERDGLFYFGKSPEASRSYVERLLVYERAGAPCRNCGKPIKRIVQAARSTYYCPGCQGRKHPRST